VKQDVLLQVLAIIHKHNADIAFPTQTLKIDPQGLSEVPDMALPSAEGPR
jgi:MscS family membrane protein